MSSSRMTPSLAFPAFQLCWRANPDVDALLRDVVPPAASVYSSFLDFLISRKQAAAAAKVWAQMVQLHQPVEAQRCLRICPLPDSRRDVTQARQVWQQATAVCDLSSYQPSPANLVINGDFSLPFSMQALIGCTKIQQEFPLRWILRKATWARIPSDFF